jgi:hypothetical protein
MIQAPGDNKILYMFWNFYWVKNPRLTTKFDIRKKISTDLASVEFYRMFNAGNPKGGSINVPLTSCVTGLESAVWQLTFFLQNRLIQTSQKGGQWYSDTSPFSIPWFNGSSALLALGLELSLTLPHQHQRTLH